MPDHIEQIGKSLVQHGDLNDRVYLMRLHPEDSPEEIISQIMHLSRLHDYSKIFTKIPLPACRAFEKEGFELEARVPGFYNGKTDGCFMSKFRKKWREQEKSAGQIDKVQQKALTCSTEGISELDGPDLQWRICDEDDAEQGAKLYGQVFETYPFPVSNPDYIKKTMREDVLYFGVWNQGNLVGLSSAEMDPDNANVEMTDFAVDPRFRGAGIALFLLGRMEEEMVRRDIKVAYTIARAVSFGINVTFSRQGYEFGGRLVNNTNISGQLESMNVWYKRLADA